jgi:hypothetical protein
MKHAPKISVHMFIHKTDSEMFGVDDKRNGNINIDDDSNLHYFVY